MESLSLATLRPERKWLIALYVGLALVTGAVSFNRPGDVQLLRSASPPSALEQAVALQRRVWESLPHHGAARLAETANPEEDIIFRVNSTRILMPMLMGCLTHLPGFNWARAFSLLRLLSIILAYCLFHLYLRRWFPPVLALLGTLFVAATMPLTFNNIFEYPTDFPEIIVFALGLWCIYESRYAWLCAVIGVGTLNRETTMFLPLILLLCSVGRVPAPRWVPAVLGAGVSWLIPFLCLRLWTGVGLHGAYGDSLRHNWQGIAHFFHNFNLYNNYLFYFYLFGAFWVLPFARWRLLPEFWRRALLSVPAFLVVYVFLGGFLDEPREIVNMFPLLVPAGLFALFEGESGGHHDQTSAPSMSNLP